MSKKKNEWGHTEIAKYLDEYGYFHPLMENKYRQLGLRMSRKFPNLVSGTEELTEALMVYQLNQGLDVTGTFDKKTQEMFETPRCGVPDYSLRGAFLNFRHAAGDIRYAITSFLPLMTANQQRAAVRMAFNYWENAGIPLRFQENTSPHIVIGSVSRPNEFYGLSDGTTPLPPPAGSSNTLAVAVTPNLPIAVGFDAADPFRFEQVPYFDFVNVATHEFGHAIGLDHSNDEMSIMYAHYVANRQRGLAADDVATIRSLYPNWWGVSWQDMRAFISSFAVGANGAVWSIARNARIRPWNEGTQNWDDPFAAHHVGWCVAVTPDGRPWVLGIGDDGENNNIYEWDGQDFRGRAGWGFDIAIGSRGDIYHIGRGGAIYKYTGINQWSYVPGARVYQPSPHGAPWGHAIAVHSDGGCWHIGAGQEIFRPAGGGWQGTGAFAYAIGSGPNGEMMHVGRGNKIWIWEGGRWVDGWSDVNATSVAVGPNGRCYHGGASNGLWRRTFR